MCICQSRTRLTSSDIWPRYEQNSLSAAPCLKCERARGSIALVHNQAMNDLLRSSIHLSRLSINSRIHPDLLERSLINNTWDNWLEYPEMEFTYIYTEVWRDRRDSRVDPPWIHEQSIEELHHRRNWTEVMPRRNSLGRAKIDRCLPTHWEWSGLLLVIRYSLEELRRIFVEENTLMESSEPIIPNQLIECFLRVEKIASSLYRRRRGSRWRTNEIIDRNLSIVRRSHLEWIAWSLMICSTLTLVWHSLFIALFDWSGRF